MKSGNNGRFYSVENYHCNDDAKLVVVDVPEEIFDSVLKYPLKNEPFCERTEQSCIGRGSLHKIVRAQSSELPGVAVTVL